MKDGRGISNAFIKRVYDNGDIIANGTRYLHIDGIVWRCVKETSNNGETEMRRYAIAVACPKWLRSQGFIKIWPPQPAERGGYTKLNNETNWWLLNHLKDSGHKATETAAKLNIMYSAPESEKVEIWKNMFSEGGKQKWH